MIQKILKIKNLGRLNIPVKDGITDENKNDDFSFKKNTLIFGDNTYGKTTLSSVFKSLKTGAGLEGRQKFQSQNTIQIKIEKDDGSIHEYGKDTWENNNILIFDNDFIKEHVFSEDQIKGEHLKSLPKVLIGDSVKSDVDQINKIIKCENGSCGNCESCFNEKLRQHNNTFSKDHQLEQFIKVENKILKADEQIKEKERTLSIDEKLVELKKKSQESSFYKLDFQRIEDLFDKRINSIFEKTIEEHLSENTNNLEKAKGFLGYGLKLKKGSICPFCSQDTANVQDFMENLSSYFDEEYISLKDEIEKYYKVFTAFDLEKELLTFDKLNFTLIEELFDKEKFEKTFKNIEEKIENKNKDLNFDCDFKNDEDFKLIKDIFATAKDILEDIIKKQALTDQEKRKLNEDLTTLKLNKYRYSPEGVTFYDEFKRIEKKLETKKKGREIAQNNLKKKVETVFGTNLENINTFLRELRADFQIKKLIPAIDNRDKNNFLKIIEYQFEFVDIQGSSISVETEKFKETFSDSDKRLLGFAFFLSTLKNDPNLEHKIIILDDPFSSFDINRKEETIKLFDSIKNNDGKESKQKIVFTHEKSFYCQLNKLVSGDKKLLKLNCSVANNGTMFEVVNMKKFESDKYYSDLEYINNAITTNNDLDEALPKARESAEYLIKAKYINTLENYRDSDNQPINFDIASINKFLEVIADKCPVKDDLEKLDLHRFHHSQPQWKTELSDTNKNKILTDFINLIEKI